MWTPARNLDTGAWLKTSSGTWIQVSTIDAYTNPVNTYNLTVAEDHTYYVELGAADVLVHNCPVDAPGENEPRFAVDSDGEVTDLTTHSFPSRAPELTATQKAIAPAYQYAAQVTSAMERTQTWGDRMSTIGGAVGGRFGVPDVGAAIGRGIGMTLGAIVGWRKGL